VVGEVGDLGKDLVVRELGDLLDHACVAALLHPEWQLGDDDRGLAAAQLFDVCPRAHDDAAAPGAVGLADALAPEDDPPVGKSGPFTCFASRSTLMSGSSIIATTPSITSARLCGGMFVAMPTAMPGAPFTSRFGKRDGRTVGSRAVRRNSERSRRCRRRCREELGRDPREARFRIAHRCGRIVVDISEVALRIDERVTHREGLRHPDERVVDGRVAVGW
jgi:hypothetical protein